MLVPQLFKPKYKYECHRSVRLARMIKMTDVLCCGVMMLESMRMILHQVKGHVKCIRSVISLRINRFLACACVIYVLILFFFIAI